MTNPSIPRAAVINPALAVRLAASGLELGATGDLQLFDEQVPVRRGCGERP